MRGGKVTRKQGKNEGSIYVHWRNGKKVGYQGAYPVHIAEGPKRRYVSGRTTRGGAAEAVEAT
jgi:hypothetical protein